MTEVWNSMVERRIPINRVKVWGWWYDLIYDNRLSADYEVDGQIHNRRQVIRLDTAQTVQAQRETLLHEVIHAIEQAQNMELSEGDVGRLARGLDGFLKDNPAFVRLYEGKD